VDTIIDAIGQTPDISCFSNDLIVSPQNTLAVDINTLATSKPGVFAGGDVVTGPATVAEAIGSGRAASRSIDRYIRGERIDPVKADIPVAQFEEINLAYFEQSKRVGVCSLPIANRIKGFREVQGGITSGEAVAEAQRCFSCGVCNGCDTCWLVCPEIAITRQNREYQVILDYCKGCGICREECPRGVITMEEEATWKK
jgi:NADPH-dependent glutamate synthase beta subunit-like oxidoreductase